MTTGELGLVLLAGAAVVLAAIVAARVAHGIGLPGLLLFLGLGLALGEAGAGVRFDDAGLAEALGLSALVLILAEGGLTTNWAHARAAAPEALSLATIGVAVSMLVVAVTTRWLLGLGWREALLLGAVLAPTDAAAVFSVLRKLPLPPRLAGTRSATGTSWCGPNAQACARRTPRARPWRIPPPSSGVSWTGNARSARTSHISSGRRLPR